MSLESAPNLSYDLPPTDERKGKTKAESDRYLRKLIISHRAKLTRYPAGTMAASRQKNVAGIPVRAPGAAEATPSCGRIEKAARQYPAASRAQNLLVSKKPRPPRVQQICIG
jgi:hypothetical protein